MSGPSVVLMGVISVLLMLFFVVAVEAGTALPSTPLSLLDGGSLKFVGPVTKTDLVTAIERLLTQR